MRGRTPGFIAVVFGALVLSGSWALAQGQGVDVRDNSFAPGTARVTAGDELTWTQSGSNPHTVTADDGSFDSHPNCPPVCMGEGETFSHTFEAAGEVGYHCKIHGSPGQGMAGTVVVEAAAEQPEDEPEATDEPAPARPEDEPDAADESQAEPDVADGSADAGAADDANADVAETAGGDEDDPDAAGAGEALADTGGAATLLPLALGLTAAGVLAVRRAARRSTSRAG